MEKMLEDLKTLVAIDSVCRKTDSSEAPFGKGAKNAMVTVLDICRKYGMTVKNCDNMVGYAETGSGDEIMGILAHLDVVPPGAGWNTDPFSLHVAGDRIYGRGVTDDKGPAIAVIHGIKELIEEGCNFNKRVRIIFGMAEETGDWDDIEYYKKTEEPVTFGFTPDADFPAIYAEKGIANIVFEFRKDETCFRSIKGGNAANMVPDFCSAEYVEDGNLREIKATGKSAHGSTPWDGDNAIASLMEKLSERKDCQLISFFRDCIGKEYDGRKLGGYAEDKESGEITFNFGLIESDDDIITLTADVRYPITKNIGEILNGIRAHIDSLGYESVDIELKADIAPVFMDANGPVITKLLEAYREHTGDLQPPAVIGGGTYARAMDGIVAFGPMLPGRELTEHQPNENILVEDLVLAKNIYKTAIRKLASE